MSADAQEDCRRIETCAATPAAKAKIFDALIGTATRVLPALHGLQDVFITLLEPEQQLCRCVEKIARMADPERLELPTPAFEAQCSIQLSYGSTDDAYERS